LRAGVDALIEMRVYSAFAAFIELHLVFDSGTLLVMLRVPRNLYLILEVMANAPFPNA
jgi:hypothetical protein